jgi:hypothetical protein
MERRYSYGPLVEALMVVDGTNGNLEDQFP